MSLDSIRAFLATEPATLRQLEAALGFSLARDARSEEAWLVRRDAPAPGILFLYVGFVGRDLHEDPDPMLDELRLFTTEVDCRAAAIAVIGPGEQRGGGEASYDIHHQTPPWAGGPTRTVPISHAWSRARGLLEIHSDAKRLYWSRHEGPYAAAWSSEEQATLLSRLARLFDGPIDDGRIEQSFGKLVMSGRGPVRFLRGPNWRLEVDPIEAPTPTRVGLRLEPNLPVEAVLAGLGWPPMLVCTNGVHMASARVIDRTTARDPMVHGSRVEVVVASTREGVRSQVKVPAQSVYETTNLSTAHIQITVGNPRL